MGFQNKNGIVSDSDNEEESDHEKKEKRIKLIIIFPVIRKNSASW